jgi:apolipoprotein N-acyltransferase
MLDKLHDWYRSTLGHALLSAAALWAALPPLNLWPLGWIAPVWWILLIRRNDLQRRPRLGSRWAWRIIAASVVVLMVYWGVILPQCGVAAPASEVTLGIYWGFIPGLVLAAAVTGVWHFFCGGRPYGSLWLAGFLFWLGALHWLRLPHWSAAFGWVGLSGYLACYLPTFVALARVAMHQLRVPVILAAPIVWSGLELLRAHFLSGFSMASLSHTQYRWIELIQVSDLAGEYGVAFVMMLVAACLARMVPCDGQRSCVDGRGPFSSPGRGPFSSRRYGGFALADVPSAAKRLWPLLPAAAIIAATIGYGRMRTSGEHTGPGANILLIQGSIDTEIKFDPEMRAEVYDHYFDLSREALERAAGEHKDVDLLVWPETMFRDALFTWAENPRKPPELACSQEEFQTGLRRKAQETRDLIAATAEMFKAPLILGIDIYHFGTERVECFNSAICVGRDGGILDRYDKVHPVPFSEYLPFAQYIPWVQQLMPLGLNLTPGTRPAAFPLGRLRLSPSICYETVLSHVIRRQVNMLATEDAEPDVLVNLTNDGWFWGSSELEVHLACAVFRAVECRKPLLIAANTGISAWIDGDGRIMRQGPKRAPGAILAEVQTDRRGSWYLAHGDWLAGLCLLACAVCAGAGLRRLWKRRAGQTRHL